LARKRPGSQKAVLRAGFFLVAVAAAALAAAPAPASTIIDRDARNATLKVDGNGFAVVSYRVGSRTRKVLAWGAVNDEVRFKLDYSGGSRTFKKPVWKTVTQCLPYDGPTLNWLVTACKAPDGSYWALQSWQRLLPNQGYAAFNKLQASRELHLSHWNGPIPQLELYVDWIYRGKYHHLFGRYQFNGKAVHGYKSTSTGVPLDPYGRNIYLDVFGSVYGDRWVRENSFLAHKPTGTFCYGFFPRKSYYDKTTRPAGHGARYRATAIGPGVSPDPYWEHAGLSTFDAAYEANMNAFNDQLMAGDRLCRQH
jgi:hypothetical protein